MAFLALFQHRGSAWVNGTVLVLGEGAVVVAIMFEAFFADETQVDIFDAVSYPQPESADSAGRGPEGKGPADAYVTPRS